MSLKTDLTDRVSACRSVARRNDRITYSLIFLSVIASAAATIGAGSGFFPPSANATLAALPGIAVTALSTFRFEARARWWWKKHMKLQQLLYALEYQRVSEAETSELMNQFLVEHEADWPSFGRPESGVTT